MEKGHVPGAHIECTCCLLHLTVMLLGVLGTTTRETDNLVLIMNATPVYWCWHHFAWMLAHFSLVWLLCSLELRP